MNRLAHLARLLLGPVAVLALAAMLSACTIISDTNLVADSEVVTPLPATFTFVGYEEKDGGYVRSSDTPSVFILEGNGYVPEDKSMKAYLSPLGDGTYLLSVTSADGVVYGVAAYEDNVLEMNVIISDEEEAVKTALTGISGAEVTADGLKVADRNALDQVVAMIRAGKLKAPPMVAYIAMAGEEPPQTLTKAGDGWTKG